MVVISLISVEIPYSVIKIEDSVFSCCNNLSSIKLPQNLIFIGNEAFCNCSDFLEIEIPNTVISIGEHILTDYTYIHNIFGGRGSLAEKYISKKTQVLI